MERQASRHYAALYCRLSKEDGDSAVSSSIQTQEKKLLAYAKENKFSVYDTYKDDGYSGTNFDRPDFKRMIEDIEAGKVNLVITKDLSRLGRDYIRTGQYTEIYFPSHDVRYIAIDDAYDSNNSNTDIMPFKNIVNEMYARDISKKIRSAFHTKMREGDYIGNFAPYGYKKSLDDKNVLVIDENVAPIVQTIFYMAKRGEKPATIVKYLNAQKILTPAQYRCEQFNHLNIDHYSQRQEWTRATLNKLLKNITYLGHTAQGKTSKVSLKSSQTISRPRDEWIVVENTHEPTVDEETFYLVQERMASRTNKRQGSFKNIFSGIAKCADCGRNMSAPGTRKNDSPANLVCGGYKLYGSKECSNHFIDYNMLYDVVLKEIRKQAAIALTHKEQLLKMANEKLEKKFNAQRKKENSDIQSLQKRYDELDKIITKVYEDNVSGKLSDERFSKMLHTYESEQQGIKEKIEAIQTQKKERDDSNENIKKYIALISKHTNLEELTPEIVYELIDHIEIGQGVYEKVGSKREKRQRIQIFYRFIGNL